MSLDVLAKINLWIERHNATTWVNLKKVLNIVLQNKWMTTGQIVEDTGGVQYNILPKWI